MFARSLRAACRASSSAMAGSMPLRINSSQSLAFLTGFIERDSLRILFDLLAGLAECCRGNGSAA